MCVVGWKTCQRVAHARDVIRGNKRMNCLKLTQARDVKFGVQIGSDWPQMGQNCDFLRSVLVDFVSVSRKIHECIVFEADLT